MKPSPPMNFVRHPKRPGWGIGRVVREDSDRIEIYFEAVGPRQMVRSMAGLEDVPSGDVGDSDLLRHLKVDAEGRYAAPPMTVEDMVQNFLRIEGGGFDHPRYVADERVYKEKAVALAAKILAPERLRDALGRGAYSEVFDAYRKTVNATNILSPFEKAKLGGVSVEKHERFAMALTDLLGSEEGFDGHFDALADTFLDLGIGSWPTCTHGLFLLRPDRHLVVKPHYVNRAADALNYSINYETAPSAKTYGRILSLAGYLREKLAARGLLPKDMIDVQGFIWIGAGGADRA
jgi:hypothetical protein